VAEVFAADVILWADGGGNVRAARHPLHGASGLPATWSAFSRKPRPVPRSGS
jgi:hypothetical protein